MLLLVVPLAMEAQTADQYLEKIRNNTAELRAFFSQMPKGGDLHHHYSGSVYAETYIQNAIDQDMYVNKATLQVNADSTSWPRFSALSASDKTKVREGWMHLWSVKDYNGVSYPPEELFFESFGKFGPATKGSLETGLMEIKNRAKEEHVDYIETMFTSIPCPVKMDGLKRFTGLLRACEQNHDDVLAGRYLDTMYTQLMSLAVSDCAVQYNTQVVDALHGGLALDDSTFTMRFQNYVSRTAEPVDVFKNLLVAFESCNRNRLETGVNIVGQEENENSMKDYWLDMQMYRYLHTKYPDVKYAMHAGELTLGVVKPEDLTWHINEAVRTAGANRIGHGVDMPYEKNCYELLRYMSRHSIPVEINLSSNEFILGVKGDAHPISLYRKFHVPIVISSDDAGILRSNLTEQYVLLAKRYPDIKYAEIKKFVYNSIRYSFIKEDGVKKKLLAQLDKEFKEFEKNISDISGKP